MPITTTIARYFGWQRLIMGVLCLGFSLWGAYDLLVTIPRRVRERAAYESNDKLRSELEAKVESGHSLTEQETADYLAAKEQEKVFAEKGVPAPVAAFDRVTQWLFISCALFAPYFFLDYIRTKRRVYRLDDDGTLHLPEGTWSASEIADIDMSRWMAKSMAWVVHADGRRVLLDDYKHRNLHLIIGSIASRMYPEAWTAEAKIVKPEEPAAESEAGGGSAADGESGGDGGDGGNGD